MTTLIQRSFAAGELSPSLQSRVDTVKYATGLATARNVYVRRDGGVDSRPGTRFIAEVKYSSLNTRLIPFVFNREQTYILEFGDEYIRFYKDGVQIKDLTLTITGITNANPAVLSYSGPDPTNGQEFELEDIIGAIGSYLNGRNFRIANVNGAGNTLELEYLDGSPVDSTSFGSYTSGGIATRVYEIASPYAEDELDDIKFTQSYDVVTLVHPLYQIRELERSSDTSWALNTVENSPGIDSPTGISVAGIVGTGFDIDYFVTAVSRTTLEESPLSTPGIPVDGAEPTTVAPHTITWTAVSDATSYNVYKWVNGIYGYIGSSAAGNEEFINYGTPPDTTITPPRAGDPFFPGFLVTDQLPTAIGSFQQRQVYGATTEFPNRVWMSRTARPKNFTNTEPLTDDDAIDFRIAGRQLNKVLHFVDIGKLIAFTTAGEWVIDGAGGPLTPTSISVVQNSYHGSSNIPPIASDNMVLFIQARGSIVRDLTFNFQSDGYQGNDLTIYSGHLVKNHTIDDWTYQQTPHSVVWAVRDDGALLSITYVREQAIIGWCRHDTLGDFKRACVVPQDLEDVTYFIVEREVDGRTVKYIEQIQTRVIDDIRDFIGVDCSLSYDGRQPSAATMTLSGGTGWTYEETLTLTASSSYFLSSDVGKYIFLNSADGETVIRFQITGYTSGTVVTGKPNITVPVAMRSVAIESWSKAITEVGGLWHLEGRDLSVFADAFVAASPNNPAYTVKTVTNGAITLDDPAAVIHAGLPFVCDIETLDIDSPNGETLTDKKKLINQVTLRVEESRGVFAGPSAPDDDGISGLYEAKVRDEEGMDDPVALKTGNIEVKIEAHWSEGGRVFIRQVDPVPLTLLSVSPTGLVPFQGVR